MRKPSRPFERYRTRSALFLIIYAVTALIFGVPNIGIVSYEDDYRILIILATSLLVVSRFVGYIKLAGYALLSSDHIRERSTGITLAIWVISMVLLANAAFYLNRFGLMDMSVTAISFGNITTAGLLLSHLLASRDRGITRSRLMRMVSGVLIILGCTNIWITRFYFISPAIGLMTIFFGIYTERKSLSLAIRQTFAAAAGSAGAGITVYFLRGYIDPALLNRTSLDPPVAITLGLCLVAAGIGYYLYSRRLYSPETAFSSTDRR